MLIQEWPLCREMNTKSSIHKRTYAFQCCFIPAIEEKKNNARKIGPSLSHSKKGDTEISVITRYRNMVHTTRLLAPHVLKTQRVTWTEISVVQTLHIQHAYTRVAKHAWNQPSKSNTVFDSGCKQHRMLYRGLWALIKCLIAVRHLWNAQATLEIRQLPYKRTVCGPSFITNVQVSDN